jgi:redox-sensitive bicupin YhaK (pirin superfamily)
MQDMLLIKPREHDLGEFVVRRLLPSATRRSIGPFIFFDHMGPAEFAPGSAISVRPHPHIGLATLTYLFTGQILHRDSLGSVQTIDPGDVNWMIAGSGIVHSERVTDEIRASGQKMEGLQLWLALPAEREEMAAEFHHYPVTSLPRVTLPGAQVTLIAGSAYGQCAPVKVFSPLFYLDVKLSAGAKIELPEAQETGLYLMSGAISANNRPIGRYDMASWIDGEKVIVSADHHTHLVVIGGKPFPQPRSLFWNFVSSRPERLEQAKSDWREGRFARIPGDDIEFIPLPE